MIKALMKAPDFSLADQDGRLHSLKDYAGSWLVLYFYPKDDTPGCTTEACSFRDNFTEYTKHGIAILGISKDTVKSHKKFGEKFDLPFPLLSDPEKTVIHAYESWGEKKFMGRLFEGILRTTFLIDPKGVVQKVYENVKPSEHAESILKDIEDVLSGSLPTQG